MGSDEGVVPDETVKNGESRISMARRRGRGRKYTWFPGLGSIYTDDSDHKYATTTYRIGDLIPPLNNAVAPTAANNAQSVFCLVPDATTIPSEQLGNTGVSLQDYVSGQDWLLKRLVGKIHLAAFSANQEGAVTAWQQVIVKAGFFVARSIDDNQAEVDLNDEETDPLAQDNNQNPWIWQRSWVLRPATDPTVGGFVPSPFPSSSGNYGSVMDGPHIDAKVARRIRREERLWFSVSVAGYDHGTTIVANNNIFVAGLMDLRFLGALRRGKNSSSF